MGQSTAVCTLTMIPMRGEPKHRSEMVSMLLFGDVFTVRESLDNWHYIQSRHDGYEGWIFARILHLVDQIFLNKYNNEKPVYSGEILATASSDIQNYYMSFGSRLPLYDGEHFYLGDECVKYNRAFIQSGISHSILDIANKYLYTPYLWGGRSLLGIDCSGFTQMVFAMTGQKIPRDAYQQAEIGIRVGNLSIALAGDLAFFSENGQKITHVGILTGDGHIIHASDMVRKDKIDEKGIFNKDLDTYTLKPVDIRRIA